jgi:SPP1 family predicted phage head-tail adaptor
MRAGDLTHRLTLERRVQAADVTVGIDTSFATVATVWGSVKGTKPAEYIDQIQVGEGPTHRMLIRYRAAKDFDHVSEGTRRWKVRGSRDPDGRRDMLEIMAEEVAPT